MTELIKALTAFGPAGAVLVAIVIFIIFLRWLVQKFIDVITNHMEGQSKVLKELTHSIEELTEMWKNSK